MQRQDGDRNGSDLLFAAFVSVGGMYEGTVSLSSRRISQALFAQSGLACRSDIWKPLWLRQRLCFKRFLLRSR